MKDFGKILCLCAVVSALLDASMFTESVPWTKSFLDTRVVAYVNQCAFTPRDHRFRRDYQHQVEGVVSISSSPIPDWEFDVTVQGQSLRTRKIEIRVEKQLLLDLKSDVLAMTAFGQVSNSGYHRCTNPAFFEMARTDAEAGLGIGRHVVIQKNCFTQLFTYIFGGIGSSHARYAVATVGVQHVIALQHYLRCCFGYVKAFGSPHCPFRGIGSLKTNVHGVEVSYGYRWSNGIEARISYIHRISSKGPLRRSWSWRFGLCVPISL